MVKKLEEMVEEAREAGAMTAIEMDREAAEEARVLRGMIEVVMPAMFVIRSKILVGNWAGSDRYLDGKLGVLLAGRARPSINNLHSALYLDQAGNLLLLEKVVIEGGWNSLTSVVTAEHAMARWDADTAKKNLEVELVRCTHGQRKLADKVEKSLRVLRAIGDLLELR